jgi:hypothetical protein
MKKDFIFAEKLNFSEKPKKETKVKKPELTKEERVARLETDFADLQAKYVALSNALAKGASFRKQVGDEQYDLIIQQKNAMEAYRNILAVRIQLLKVS